MCFSLAWLEQLFVYLVIVGAIIALLKLLIPYVTAQIHPIIGQALTIILWAVVAIICIYIVFALISCLAGGGNFGLLPPAPHR